MLSGTAFIELGYGEVTCSCEQDNVRSSSVQKTEIAEVDEPSVRRRFASAEVLHLR